MDVDVYQFHEGFDLVEHKGDVIGAVFTVTEYPTRRPYMATDGLVNGTVWGFFGSRDAAVRRIAAKHLESQAFAQQAGHD